MKFPFQSDQISSPSSTEPRGLEAAPCPKCGARDNHVVLDGKDHLHALPGRYSVCECESCRFWYLNPRPAARDLASLYPNDYAPHAKTLPYKLSEYAAESLAQEFGYHHLSTGKPQNRSLRAPIDRARFRWKSGVGLIPHFVSGGAVLDIGAASGARLAELRELGWTDLHGIELVPAAAARARALGLDVICGSVEQTLDNYPDASFDVVVTSMVLEHLANPFEVVAKVAAKLRPGGQFLFSTITRDSLDARMFGEYWAGFDFPRHLVFLRDVDIDDMIRSQFTTIGRFHHAAAQDFVRPATWRRHEGRWIDRIILAAQDPLLRYRASLLLAWSGLTCRVSYRCQRKE